MSWEQGRYFREASPRNVAAPPAPQGPSVAELRPIARAILVSGPARAREQDFGLKRGLRRQLTGKTGAARGAGAQDRLNVAVAHDQAEPPVAGVHHAAGQQPLVAALDRVFHVLDG